MYEIIKGHVLEEDKDPEGPWQWRCRNCGLEIRSVYAAASGELQMAKCTSGFVSLDIKPTDASDAVVDANNKKPDDSGSDWLNSKDPVLDLF